MKLKLLLFVLLLPLFAQGQILDDTTKQLYGPRTTRFRTERDVFYNIDTLYRVDTTIRFFHQSADFNFSTPTVFMDLGNLGTALRPLFFSVPNRLGVQPGYSAYAPYAFTAADIQYFNTLSPYTYLNYVQGGSGRQILRTGISRNIDARTNLGIHYKRITSQKQIGLTRPDERNADHHSVAINGSYISYNGRLQAYAFFAHMNHLVNETGPIKPTWRDSTRGRLSTDSLFDYEQELVQLNASARSRELRNDWHLYTQYAFGPRGRMQFFYQFDRQRQKNSYLDRNPRASAFYQNPVYFTQGFFRRRDSLSAPAGWQGGDTVSHETRYNNIEHRAGLKAQLGALHAASWLRARLFGMSGMYNVSYAGLRNFEYYWGGEAGYRVNDSLQVGAFIEAMPGGDYLARGHVQLKYIYLAAESRKYSPTYVENRYVGNLQEWYNSFSPSIANSLTAQAGISPLRWLDLGAGATYSRIQNYIFFNQNSLPQQLNEVVSPLVVNARLNLRAGRFHFDNQAYVTQVSGPDVIRMPKLWAWARWYYENRVYRKSLLIQTGFDTRWNQAWYADQWNPTIQQWFIQAPNDPRLSAGEQPNFLIAPYAVIDVFLNVGIKRAVVFLKVNNANQGLGAPGYFTAPLYPGIRRTFQFGLIWRFYD